MASIIGLAFYVGTLQGQKEQGSNLVLSCSEDVLSKLKIPLSSMGNRIEDSAIEVPDSSASLENVVETKGAFAGSKNGTKYYTPGCTGLNRIKPENLIWFESAEDATLQGYTPAKC